MGELLKGKPVATAITNEVKKGVKELKANFRACISGLRCRYFGSSNREG